MNLLRAWLAFHWRRLIDRLALEKIERCTPDDVDTAKAWTCAAHIVSTGGDMMNEGFLLSVDDRMFWDNVHASLANGD